MIDSFKSLAVFGTALVLLFLSPPTSCATQQTSNSLPPALPEVSLALGEFLSQKRSLQQEEDTTALIQGGQTAEEDRFPYMTLFLDRHDDQACGGVLVHKRWVATAAHCLDRKARVDGKPIGLNPLMVIGAFDITDRKGTRKNVQEENGLAVLHPKWNGNPRDGHDIALVKLSTPAKQKPIALAAPGSTLLNHDMLIALGWGRKGPKKTVKPTRLKRGTLLFTNNEDCNRWFWKGIVKPSMMCGAPRTGADVCKGDSGGPVILPHMPGGKVENGKPRNDVLVGLVSFGEPNRCESSEPIDRRKAAVFTRISYFQQWINKVIAADGEVEDEAEGGGGRSAATAAAAPPPRSLSEEEKGKLNEQLIDASKDGRLNDVKAAINLGANINHKNGANFGETSLHLAAEGAHVSVVEYLIKQEADVNLENDYGDTPLSYASNSCISPDVVTLIIDSGADVNHQSDTGSTALHSASINGRLECVNILIKEGASLNMQTNVGNTALVWAAFWCNPTAAQALVDAGANTKLKNEDGETARDVMNCRDDQEDKRRKLKEILGD